MPGLLDQSRGNTDLLGSRSVVWLLRVGDEAKTCSYRNVGNRKQTWRQHLDTNSVL